MRNAVIGVFVVLCAVPAVASAQATVEEEVRSSILEGIAYVAEHLTGQPDGYPREGALEFWSSGGLMISVPPGATGETYEMFDLEAKHIEVIVLPGGEAAVAMYYQEGSMWPKGYPQVEHYLTRVTTVLVKEDGRWKTRAAHFSPLLGGSGTSQTAP